MKNTEKTNIEKTETIIHPLPDFLCVGVEKSGTTSLYDLLKQHSDIGLSSHKETHFFNTHWHKGLHWYQEKFHHLNETSCKVIGEITPAYHRFDEVIPRIKETLGEDIKIIFMLREPRRRAFSHYIHDFAINPQITDLLYKRYLSTCAYSPIVKNYQQIFGKENCLTLIFEEDFLINQQITMDKVCNFLSVETYTAEPIHSNPSYLPRFCQSPNYPSKIQIENKQLTLSPNSPLFYTHRSHTSKDLSDLSIKEQQWFKEQTQKAIREVPAIKSSIIYEQNVKADLDQLETLLDRDLSAWRKDLPDLKAKIAPQPEFLPI